MNTKKLSSTSLNTITFNIHKYFDQPQFKIEYNKYMLQFCKIFIQYQPYRDFILPLKFIYHDVSLYSILYNKVWRYLKKNGFLLFTINEESDIEIAYCKAFNKIFYTYLKDWLNNNHYKIFTYNNETNMTNVENQYIAMNKLNFYLKLKFYYKPNEFKNLIIMQQIYTRKELTELNNKFNKDLDK